MKIDVLSNVGVVAVGMRGPQSTAAPSGGGGVSARVAKPAMASSLAPPSALATERFNAVMNGQPPVQAVSQGASLQDAGSSGVDRVGPMPSSTLGSRMLESMTELSRGWRETITHVQGLPGNISLSQALDAQSRILRESLKFELVTKSATKLAHNVDALIKNN